jgi:NifU-like protein involved in Fe-S cluster formation
MIGSEMALSKQLAEHLKSPMEAPLLGPSAQVGRGENVACGDDLRLEVVWSQDGCLEVGYRVVGCGALIAVTSLCVSQLLGLGRAEVRAFDVAAVVAAAGGLDRRGAHAARVFERALGAALSL